MHLDHRLNQSSEFIADLTVCQARLSHNAAFPWLLLIPKIDNVTEIIHLSSPDQHLLMDEIALISKILQDLFIPDKINIATLGNVVPQLHIHVIARYQSDAAWPNPVWNTVNQEYSETDLQARVELIRQHIQFYFQ
ncbi:MAG: HIT family protein [Candidatus Paracaedibacteraceae bacterium]|nr:HIT family protein [Candidatus Paracaedibacteraceae bacterium]